MFSTFVVRCIMVTRLVGGLYPQTSKFYWTFAKLGHIFGGIISQSCSVAVHILPLFASKASKFVA